MPPTPCTAPRPVWADYDAGVPARGLNATHDDTKGSEIRTARRAYRSAGVAATLANKWWCTTAKYRRRCRRAGRARRWVSPRRSPLVQSPGNLLVIRRAGAAAAAAASARCHGNGPTSFSNKPAIRCAQLGVPSVKSFVLVYQQYRVVCKFVFVLSRLLSGDPSLD